VILLILTPLLFSLTGCAERIVERTVIVTRVPPKTMLTDCKPNEPPSAQDLLTAYIKFPKAKSPWEAIALMMQEHWAKQTVQVGLCNDKIQSIKDWYNKQPTLEKNHDTTGGADPTR
jgi:hypothetical protein